MTDVTDDATNATERLAELQDTQGDLRSSVEREDIYEVIFACQCVL
jgi:hypothetical protein